MTSLVTLQSVLSRCYPIVEVRVTGENVEAWTPSGGGCQKALTQVMVNQREDFSQCLLLCQRTHL